MIRREPEGIVAAALMDPGRRDLFVEGSTDKALLKFFLKDLLVDTTMTRIFAIDEAVDCKISLDGCKGRILYLAALAAEKRIENLAFFVDSDMDFLTGQCLLSNAIYTEMPDVESHSISLESLDKALKVGYGIDSVDAAVLHDRLLGVSSSIGLLRYVSKVSSLGLSINKTKKDKCLTMVGRDPVFDIRKYVLNVCLNTSIKNFSVDNILSELEEKKPLYESNIISKRIRGKDYHSILDWWLKKNGIQFSTSSAVMMATIDPSNILDSNHFVLLKNFFNG